MTDVARLRKTLEFIHAHPEEHNQQYWAVKRSCGTTMCLGGTVVHQAGYKLQWQQVSSNMKAATMAVHPATGEIVNIEDEAADLLRIDHDDVQMLFHRSESIGDLYTVARDITRGEIAIPMELL
jgi:hypothetical protein